MTSTKAVGKTLAELLADAKQRRRFDKTTLEPIVARRSELAKGEQRFIWDPLNPGFGLKITPDKAVFLVERRMPDGKNVRFVLDNYRAITIEEARERAQDVFRKMRQGINPVAEKKLAKAVAEDQKKIADITLLKVLDDYLETYPGLRPKTKDVYRKAINHCFGDGAIRTKRGEVIREPVWNSWLHLAITEIDEDMVAERQRILSSANGPRGKGEAQANQGMRVLRTLFNFAIEHYKDSNKQRIVTLNPVRALKVRRLWNDNVARDDLIEDDQLADWYNAVMSVDNETVRDFLLLLIFSGLRRGEASLLTLDRVRETGDRPYLVIPKEHTKNGVAHKLPLSDFLVCLLKRRRELLESDNVVPIHGKRYVFPGDNADSPIVEPKRVIAKVIEQSKVEFSCHSLRRTFSAIAARLDIAHYKHKKLMNHSPDDVTDKHYGKLKLEDLREPMQKIADHIKANAKIDLEDFKLRAGASTT